ncbi:MAG TPA: nuclease-related domain-containing protein [Kurthia gibsonii]|nr:nuclease-related domain-containing protein [Kurthia gibsonii]
MAQLIKLQDYISRYQVDATRYPTQYIRMKQAKWERMKKEWETKPLFEETWEEEEEVLWEDDESTPKKFFKKLNPFKKRKQDFEYDDYEEEIFEKPKQEEEEDIGFAFEPNLLYRPQTIQDLRRMYLDQLFGFQLNWASTTMREKSNIDPRYQRDVFLKELLQQLPDTFFVLYEPILLVKKAPVELGILILTPTDCYCIQVIDAEERATFSGINTDRFWVKRIGERTKNIVNPLIGLNRMKSLLKPFFEHHGLHLGIKKVVLSRRGYIDYPGSSYGVQFIDRRHYDQWFEQLKNHRSPMKHTQFRAAQLLLDHMQTTSFMRAEWFTDGE